MASGRQPIQNELNGIYEGLLSHNVLSGHYFFPFPPFLFLSPFFSSVLLHAFCVYIMVSHVVWRAVEVWCCKRPRKAIGKGAASVAV